MRKFPLVLAVILFIHLLLLSNFRFTAWPEMFSYPFLFSRGFVLYRDFIHPYPPLLTVILSVIYSVFGFKIAALKIFSWLIILFSDLFLYLILKKIIKKTLIIFLFLILYIPLQVFLDGNMLWFDNALVLPLVASLYFLINWLTGKKSKDLILTSIFLTTGVFIKQTAIIYFLMVAIYIFFTSIKDRNKTSEIIDIIKRLLLVPIVCGLFLLAYLVSTSSLRDFWNWTVYYPLTFWTKFPGYKELIPKIPYSIIYLLLFLPATLILVRGRKLFSSPVFCLVFIYLLISLLTIYPRFTPFHFQPTLALLFIIYALIAENIKFNFRPFFFLPIVFALAISFKTLPRGNETRFFGKEDLDLARQVSQIAKREDSVYLLGISSTAYVLANRLPPKPWTDNFGWYLEAPGVQDRILESWMKVPPKVILVKDPIPGNWSDIGTYQPKLILNWIEENYVKERELKKGIWIWQRKI